MSAGYELQVDTGWIRRAAATMEVTAHRFASAALGTGPVVATGALGSDAVGEAVARLVGLRCVQGTQAADQLAAVAEGLSRQLGHSADAFDRLETGARGPR